MSEPKGPTYLPCPFCGKAPDPTDRSTLHPTGIYWMDDAEVGCRTYHSHQERRENDGKCWSFNCLIESGGCGAEIHGDTEESAIAAWNRRPGGGEAAQPLDRGEVVNLAFNLRRDGLYGEVTLKGIKMLVDGALAMDAELRRLYRTMPADQDTHRRTE